MNSRHFFPKRILAAVLLAFVLMVSSVCVVNSSNAGTGQTTSYEQDTPKQEIPSKEEQIAKNTKPLVEISDVETPLSQTTLNNGFNIWYLMGIVILAVLICAAASYHKSRHKNHIFLRRVCKDSDEKSREDREIDG